MMFDMSGHVVIITGALGNLGTAAAHRFKSAGARMVLVDRTTDDRLPKAYPELANSPDHFLASGVDVTDVTSLTQFAKQVAERFGRIDGLVNTIGGFRGGTPVHQEDLETWEFLFKVNVMSTLNSCRAVIPHLLANGKGTIVNTASLSACTGTAGLGAYSASKSAVLRLTESLASELKDHGVTVNAILPGTLDTPQNRKAMPDQDVSKWVEPDAVADVILFLSSAAARSVTGAAIPITGKA